MQQRHRKLTFTMIWAPETRREAKTEAATAIVAKCMIKNKGK
jgi:hypothetical protein